MAERDPVPITRLKSDGRHWPVVGRPIDETVTPGYRWNVRVRRTSRDRLDLAPDWSVRSIGALCVGVALAGAAGLVVAIREDYAAVDRESYYSLGSLAFWSLFLLVPAVHGVNHFAMGTYFDHQRDRLIRRRNLFARSTRTLDDLLAVQCLYSGPRKVRRFTQDVYECNLIFKKPDLNRLTVHVDTSDYRVRAVAAELAEFLDVPRVDQIVETKEHYQRNKPKSWW